MDSFLQRAESGFPWAVLLTARRSPLDDDTDESARVLRDGSPHCRERNTARSLQRPRGRRDGHRAEDGDPVREFRAVQGVPREQDDWTNQLFDDLHRCGTFPPPLLSLSLWKC